MLGILKNEKGNLMKAKREEITDLVSDKGIRELKVGQVLKFQTATIRITKIDKKNMRIWGEHVALVDQNKSFGHYGHIIDTTEEAQREHGAPYCTECEVAINEAPTVKGKQKVAEREERTLADGTEIS